MKSGHFFDLDLVGIKGEVAGNFGHRWKRTFVSPDRICNGFSVGIDAEIVRISLLGTMRHPLAARKQRHIRILARQIVDRRIARFLQRQGIGRFGNHDPACGNAHAPRICRDRDRMVGTW